MLTGAVKLDQRIAHSKIEVLYITVLYLLDLVHIPFAKSN